MTSESNPRGPGRLSVVATPIGNLDDITLRALRVLREADAILAEDTRRTGVLCAHHGIGTRLVSYHAHSDPGKTRALVAELVAGARYALVTDAGTPLVSDPGFALVAAAREAGVEVLSIPGASAVTTALCVAGIPCDSFRFVGFLPRSGPRRRHALAALAHDTAATVLFEAPTRLAETLRDLADVLGESRAVAVCRELTKLHEEVARGSARELAERFAEGARGEITLVVGGAPTADASEGDLAADDAAAIDAHIRSLRATGLKAKEIAKRIAETTGMPAREAYRRVLEAE